MTDHLPECPKGGCPGCYSVGYSAALDAAWEAVAAAPRHYWVSWAIEVDAALSAIDALKEKP